MIDALRGRLRWLVRGRSTTAAVMQTTVLQIVTLVANFATGILTARMLAPTGRGELAAINLIPGLVGYLLTLGIPGALLYELKRQPNLAARYLGAAIGVTTALGALGVAIGYAIMPYALHRYSPHVVDVARWFMLTAPLSLYGYIATSAYDSAGNFWYGNASRFLSPLLTLLCLCAFWATGHLDVLTAALSYALPALPVNAKMMLDAIRSYRPRLLPLQAKLYADLFSYGLRSFGIDVLRTIGGQIDQVLVITFLSPSKMGLYAVALAISRMLQVFQNSVVRVLLPRIAARPAEEIVPAVGRAARITAALTTPLCVIVLIATPLLLRITYGGKFSAAADVLRVLTVEAVFAGSTWILAQAFLAVGRPATVTALQATGLALSVPIMVVFIPHFGLVGAGYALLLSTWVRLMFILACFPWLLKVAPPGLLLTRADVRSLRERIRSMRGRGADPSAATAPIVSVDPEASHDPTTCRADRS